MLVIQNHLRKAACFERDFCVSCASYITTQLRIDNGLSCLQNLSRISVMWLFFRLVFVDSQCNVENVLLTTSWRGDRRRFAWRLERWTVRWGEAGTERVEDQTTDSPQTGFPPSELEARRRTTPAGPNRRATVAPEGHRDTSSFTAS